MPDYTDTQLEAACRACRELGEQLRAALEQRDMLILWLKTYGVHPNLIRDKLAEVAGEEKR